jgi:NADPH:quinone reductase-like Zn-dependent oxidoreductase
VAAEVYGELAGFIAAGQLHSRVQAVFPLSQIRQAITAAASRERNGKIIIVPPADWRRPPETIKD